MTKEQVGEKRVYLAHTSVLLFIPNRNQDRNSKQSMNLEARADVEAIEGCCLLACSSWLAWFDFLQNPETPV